MKTRMLHPSASYRLGCWASCQGVGMPAGRPSILVTRMLAQMCRNTWKSKEMPIHNGTHKGGAAAEGGRPTFVGAAEGRPHYG